MKAKTLFKMAIVATLIVACNREEAPSSPTEQAAPPAQEQVAVSPAPAIVYASAEPQHGGVRQRVGDYMVELATGTQGRINAYIQKYEGDVPSFEDVQVEMQVQPKEETAQATPEPQAEGKEKPTEQNVIFYPKDGKLEGTVAGLPQGDYDVDVKVFDIKDDKMAQTKFENVKLEPVDVKLEPKNGGEVEVIDQTKMEVARQGQTVKLWLRDLEDKELKPSEAAVKQLTVNLKDGSKEQLEVEAKEDHFEAEVKGEIDPESFKIMMADLAVAGQEYAKLRVPEVGTKTMAADTEPKTKTEDEKPAKQGRTKSNVQKRETKEPLSGTVGTMKIDKTPVRKPAETGEKTTPGPSTRATKQGVVTRKKPTE